MRLTIDLSRSRVETKYSIADEDVPALTCRIPSDEREDYAVLTHYFDRADGSLRGTRSRIPSIAPRSAPASMPSPSVWFEVKTRRGCWTRKSRLRLSRSEAARLVRGLSPSEAEAFEPLSRRRRGRGAPPSSRAGERRASPRGRGHRLPEDVPGPARPGPDHARPGDRLLSSGRGSDLGAGGDGAGAAAPVGARARAGSEARRPAAPVVPRAGVGSAPLEMLRVPGTWSCSSRRLKGGGSCGRL